MTTKSTVCFFNDCENPVVPGSWKCLFHRRRSRCLVANCANQVYARSLCVRHGGRRQCQHDNCTMNQRVGNFCSRHATAGLKKMCAEPGCGKQAHARGRCVRHGGGRLCKTPNCIMHARHGAYCSHHIPVEISKFDFEPVDQNHRRESMMALDSSILMEILQDQVVGKFNCIDLDVKPPLDHWNTVPKPMVGHIDDILDTLGNIAEFPIKQEVCTVEYLLPPRTTSFLI
ncbi:hypothetical protein LEN26_004324 [Aphanomyces euteiches]|nr:hypothetical protein LEN26_004324 [Aphanomyces euteiches]